MTTSQTTRNTLEKMCRDERIAERCILTKQLYAESKELVSTIDADIQELQIAINLLIAQKNALGESRTEVLKEHKLNGIVDNVRRNSGWCELEDEHPKRIEFDKETSRQLKEILTMK